MLLWRCTPGFSRDVCSPCCLNQCAFIWTKVGMEVDGRAEHAGTREGQTMVGVCNAHLPWDYTHRYINRKFTSILMSLMQVARCLTKRPMEQGRHRRKGRQRASWSGKAMPQLWARTSISTSNLQFWEFWQPHCMLDHTGSPRMHLEACLLPAGKPPSSEWLARCTPATSQSCGFELRETPCHSRRRLQQ